MGNEVDENLRLFFRPFLNTPEGVDADHGNDKKQKTKQNNACFGCRR